MTQTNGAERLAFVLTPCDLCGGWCEWVGETGMCDSATVPRSGVHQVESDGCVEREEVRCTGAADVSPSVSVEKSRE
jgi:NADH:ubiquinone oxidoreductase subunit E